ncbi:MAG: PPC domain-containing DNA-binding protein [Thermoplasmatota archaeon]
MQYKEEGALVVAKFTGGDVIHNLEQLALERNIHSAAVVSGIGMLSDAVIGFFDGREYVTHTIEGAAELVSLNGNVGREADSGRVVCHLHVALATADHALLGGHLLEGRVTVVNEIILHRLEHAAITRRRNQQGLLEMHLD